MTRILVTTLLLLLLVPAARADGPRPPEVLSAESERALALARDGKLDDAVAIWMDILDEVPPQGRADVHVNLAVAFTAQDRLPEAWYHLDAYLTEAPKEDPAVAAERAAIEKKLSATHVPLRFSCAVAETQLFFTPARIQAYPCPLRWWFPRGTEGEIFASAAGHVPGETPIRAHELDRDRRVIVRLEPAPPEVPDEPTLPIPAKPAVAKGGVWKWSLFGGGVGLVAVGAVLQVMAFNKDQQLRKDYPGDATDYAVWQSNRKAYQDGFKKDVKPMAYGAYALYGVGGAAAATGLVFLVMDWTKPAPAKGVHVAPLAAPGMLGLTLDLDF
jgi:hypothetical protein